MAKAVERHFDTRKLAIDGHIPESEIEPMPWPYEMGRNIFDANSFKFLFLPWPTKGWQYNSNVMDCIQIVYYMKLLLEKDPDLWTPEQDRFYKNMHKLSKEFAVWPSHPDII